MYKIRPHITEKSVNLAKDGKYTFVVSKELDKIGLIKMLKKVFKVNPLSVKIINKKSAVRKTARRKVKEAGLKKAIVELKKGEKITGFEVLDEKSKQLKGEKQVKK
ncbi:MAG: 50S ribosomal protein L23 [Candidatus Berkelbacteria bacterium]|nr:50S ribosomal protein L23 [Candidatus Berkelbacteria bacterium]